MNENKSPPTNYGEIPPTNSFHYCLQNEGESLPLKDGKFTIYEGRELPYMNGGEFPARNEANFQPLEFRKML